MRHDPWPVAFVSTGVLLAASAIVHIIALAPLSALHLAIDILVVGGAAAGFFFAAYWYQRKPFEVARGGPLLGWMLGAGILFVGLGLVALYLGSEDVLAAEFIEVVHISVAAGLVAGLLVGTIHLDAIRQAEVAARAEARANALHEEQERLDHLTDMLRHYILNAVNVISGYTRLLAEEVPDGEAEPIETIDDRARMIATLIEHVQSIQTADPVSSSSDLPAVLEAVVDELARHEWVTVREPPAVPPVRTTGGHLREATVLLAEVMTDIAGDRATLTLTCEREDGMTRISLRGRPAALPGGIDEALEEPVGSAIGLRVYLTQRLLAPGGNIELHEPTTGVVACEISVPVAAEGDSGLDPGTAARGDAS